MEKQKIADLHIHSYYSDGSESPFNIIKKAKEKGFNTISITDHETFDAVEEAKEAAKLYDIQLIPGVEISTFTGRSEVHILGYFKSIKNTELLEVIEGMQKARFERVVKMVEKLKKHGVEIEIADIVKVYSKNVVTRLHVAMVILQKREYATTMREVFDKYIGFNAPCFVPRDKTTASETIKLILDFKGIPVLAHPGVSSIDESIPKLISAGLKGIEVFYPIHSKKQRKQYLELAESNNLLITGGSDCHGKFKRKEYLGKIKLEEQYINNLMEALNK
jgi:3',5'-nucleoside bisphosphate phosphatase